MSDLLDQLERVPRLGWVSAPSPLTALAPLAQELGFASLTVKRDDQLASLFGGSKVRKLDVLLATEPFAHAPALASAGAIGSGHLVTAAAAAQRLGRAFTAHCFWEPPLAGVLATLATTATQSTRLCYYGSRAALALRRPDVLFGWPPCKDEIAIPPGASCAAGAAGMVWGALELMGEINAGRLPRPDVVYVALGSGGTAAGLALGFALAGLTPRLRAVSVVERPLSPAWRLRGLVRATGDWLAERGVQGASAAAQRACCEIVRGYVGRRYGVATPASLAACARFVEHSLHLEPIYTGKAAAALLREAAAHRGQNVLFWGTSQRPLPPPVPDWHARLPRGLARRLELACCA